MDKNDTTLIPDNGTPPPASQSQRIAGHERGPRTTMRAADADRDRVAEYLGAAYSEGRLSKDEYDARLENALSARTYADLDQLVTDLPAPRKLPRCPPWSRPPCERRVNRKLARRRDRWEAGSPRGGAVTPMYLPKRVILSQSGAAKSPRLEAYIIG